MQRVVRLGLFVFLLACSLPQGTAQAQWQLSNVAANRGQPQLLGMSTGAESQYQATVPHVVLGHHARQSFAKAVSLLDVVVTNSEVFEAPLTSAIAHLEDQLGQRILLDAKALTDAAIGTDTLVNCGLPSGTLRRVLEELLLPHDLTWVPQPAGLVITTRHRASTAPEYRPVVIYPVYDLVAVSDGRMVQHDFDSLIDLVTTVVHPETWKEGGTGEGVIAPHDGSASIIVAQEWPIHEEISGLLSGLRKVKVQQRLGNTISTSLQATNVDDPLRYQYQMTSRPRHRVRWASGR